MYTTESDTQAIYCPFGLQQALVTGDECSVASALVLVIWPTAVSYRNPLTLEATIATLSDNHETVRESNFVGTT
jgi:hypothetical protein